LSEPNRGTKYLQNLNIFRAALVVGLVTLVITILGAVTVRLFDHSEFPNVWLGIWWALQTVTTVGYGDIVPKDVVGRIAGGIVMVAGIAVVTVFTAIVTAAFIESARRRRGLEDPVLKAIQDVSDRLGALESEPSRRA
jgi:voltage-gated potassium channel